jgi:hypothetical protein
MQVKFWSSGLEPNTPYLTRDTCHSSVQNSIFTSQCCYVKNVIRIRLFRIISIPSTFCYFRPPDHVISMECTALDFRCQCTQQKLQSICAVLTFDPQLKKISTFSVKDRYQLNYFICTKDFNAETITSLKLNLFSFFICGCRHHERKIFLISARQWGTEHKYLFSRFLGVSILQLLVIYRIYNYDMLTLSQ